VLIVDTPVIAPFVPADETAHQPSAVTEAIKEGRCMAATLWSWEMANVLSKAVRSGRLANGQLGAALQGIAGFGILTEPRSAEMDMGPTLALANRHGLTAYHASYLELALRLGADLATHDGSLRKAATAEGLKAHPAA
jgi:predicted nucleic acid-binding protein